MRVVHVGTDAQDATALHRFEAVFDHVIERLLDLAAIELEQRQIGTQFLLDHDVAILNFWREKAHCFIDNRVHAFRMQLRLGRPNRAQELRDDGIEPAYLGAGDVD